MLLQAALTRLVKGNGRFLIEARSGWRQGGIIARGSGCSLARVLLATLSTCSPDHAAYAARPFASGCLLWDMRLKVDALILHSSATCFEVQRRACLSASRAAKKAPPSNFAAPAMLSQPCMVSLLPPPPINGSGLI